jgi:hypothetical protein
MSSIKSNVFMRETYTIAFSKVIRQIFVLVVRHINIITAKFTITFILDIFPWVWIFTVAKNKRF